MLLAFIISTFSGDCGKIATNLWYPLPEPDHDYEINVADEDTTTWRAQPRLPAAYGAFHAAGWPHGLAAGCNVMAISCRMFLLDQDDRLYRLPNTKFEQMLRDPTNCRITRFAGARVRMTDVAVELAGRKPLCVVRNAFGLRGIRMSAAMLGCPDGDDWIAAQAASGDGLPKGLLRFSRLVS